MRPGRRTPRIEIVDDAMADVLRAKSGAERLRIADGMFRMARRLIRAAMHEQHPDWDEQRVKLETARRISHGTVGTAPARR
jgi:hypothetical protein